MGLKNLIDRFAFWRPKAERLQRQSKAIPRPKAELTTGLRLMEQLSRQFSRSARARRIDRQAAAAAHWSGACGSKRRPFTRRAITAVQRQRELAISRKPAKPIPTVHEKRPCGETRWQRFDPTTGRKVAVA